MGWLELGDRTKVGQFLGSFLNYKLNIISSFVRNLFMLIKKNKPEGKLLLG